MTFNHPGVLNPTLTFLLKPVAIRSICNGLPVCQDNAAEYYNPKDNATDYTVDDFFELVNRSDHSSDKSYDRTTDFEASENHINGAEPSRLGIDVLEGYQNTDYSANRNVDSDMESDDTFGYPPEHAVQVMDPSKEYDTNHTDDSYELVNKSDQSSDESFEFGGSEESYDRTTDFEENEDHRSEAEPSGLGTDVLDEGYQSTINSTSGNEDSDIENEDTFGSPLEYSVQVLDPSKQHDIDYTDDSYKLVNKSDQSSDESFEFGGSEESYDRTTDFEEIENHRSEAEPSGSGTDVLDEGYQLEH
ncbi:hypothetical protein LguiB_033137 [Lonicera macranthoides]